jgi:ribosomal protein S14
MLYLKYKDIKNRKKFYRQELKKNLLKFFFINSLNKIKKKEQKKQFISYYLSKLNQKVSKTKLQRRCVLNNRSKVPYRKLAISRIKLREMLKYNIIPGYQKAIW